MQGKKLLINLKEVKFRIFSDKNHRYVGEKFLKVCDFRKIVNLIDVKIGII